MESKLESKKKDVPNVAMKLEYGTGCAVLC